VRSYLERMLTERGEIAAVSSASEIVGRDYAPVSRITAVS
jgi:hypothetical protein